jgi:hypothetical protein
MTTVLVTQPDHWQAITDADADAGDTRDRPSAKAGTVR